MRKEGIGQMVFRSSKEINNMWVVLFLWHICFGKDHMNSCLKGMQHSKQKRCSLLIAVGSIGE